MFDKYFPENEQNRPSTKKKKKKAFGINLVSNIKPRMRILGSLSLTV